MANKFSLITKYLTKALDSAMVTESKTAILERNDKFIDYDVKGANEVRIAKILMDGFGNYGRANYYHFYYGYLAVPVALYEIPEGNE